MNKFCQFLLRLIYLLHVQDISNMFFKRNYYNLSFRYRLGATDAMKHSWINMLGGVGGRVSSPWPMAKLDMPQLKTFLARRKWHVSRAWKLGVQTAMERYQCQNTGDIKNSF